MKTKTVAENKRSIAISLALLALTVAFGGFIAAFVFVDRIEEIRPQITLLAKICALSIPIIGITLAALRRSKYIILEIVICALFVLFTWRIMPIW